MKVKCGNCGLRKTTIFYLSLTKALCRDCFVCEKQTLKEMVQQLPFVETKPAPLGHRFFWHEVIADEKKAEQFCVTQFGLYRAGVVN